VHSGVTVTTAVDAVSGLPVWLKRALSSVSKVAGTSVVAGALLLRTQVYVQCIDVSLCEVVSCTMQCRAVCVSTLLTLSASSGV
jgi:hypothetical protein